MGCDVIIASSFRTKSIFKRIKYLKFTLLFAATALLGAGCAQPEGSVGGGVGGGPEGRLSSVICESVQDTSFRVNGTLTGGSAHLYVGESNGISSEALIRFNRPTRPFEWTVDSARVEFAWQGAIGGEPLQTAPRGTLVILPWSESNPPERDSIPDGVALNGEVSISDTSGRLILQIPPAEISSWLNWVDSSASDTGWSDPNRADSALSIHLTVESTDRLFRFRARSATEDSLKPWLWIFVTVRDEAGGTLHPDTLRMLAAGDLFLAKDANAPPLDRMVVGSGAAIRSAILFDLSPIWNLRASNHIAVNRATITLTRDRTSYTWAPWTRSLWPYQMTSRRWTTEPDSAEYSGFVLIPTAVDSASDTIQLVVTTPTSNWARGDSTNFGLLIEAAGEGLDIDRIVFYNGDDPDSAKRPRLVVFYTELAR